MMPSERRSRNELTGHTETSAFVRLRSGVRLSVLAGAEGGWHVESVARLMPGSVVEVVVGAGDRKLVERAVVARSEVVAIDRRHGVRYRAQLERLREPEFPSGSSYHADGNQLPARREHVVPMSPK
jgi:hypothetical protein